MKVEKNLQTLFPLIEARGAKNLIDFFWLESERERESVLCVYSHGWNQTVMVGEGDQVEVEDHVKVIR